MVNALQDGLNLPDLLAECAVGATEIGSYAILTKNISGSQITSATIAADAVTYDKLAYGQVITGSPSVAGQFVQFGSSASTAGSILDVVFGTAFKAAPTFVAVQQDGGALIVTAGSLTTTGASAITAGGSKTVSWIACGSGTFG